jgi:hypothetical protein
MNAASNRKGRRCVPPKRALIRASDEDGKLLVDVHPLRRNLAVLEGSGGNITVLTGVEADILPSQAFDAKWGQFLITPSAFTGLVYQGV